MDDTEAQTPEPEASPEGEETASEEADSEQDLRDALVQQQDALARARADLENTQKRHERERAVDRLYRVEPLARELLDLRDTLEDSWQAMKQQTDEVPDSLRKGQELLLRQLEQIFEKFAITVIDPENEVFDPQHHEAMTTQPSEDVAPGHVIEVVRRGYCLHDRLLRPAQVVVAAEAAKPDAPEDEDSS